MIMVNIKQVLMLNTIHFMVSDFNAKKTKNKQKKKHSFNAEMYLKNMAHSL